MAKPPLSLAELKVLPAPYPCDPMAVEPQWIDYNGHLNMAYYNVIFDRSVDQLYKSMGLGVDYLKARGCSTMTAECHIRYLRELALRDPVQVSILIVATDDKRIHTFKELRHATDGWLSATSENMSLHIDMTVRKVAAFPPDIAERVRAATNAHAAAARSEAVGRRIAMPGR